MTVTNAELKKEMTFSKSAIFQMLKNATLKIKRKRVYAFMAQAGNFKHPRSFKSQKISNDKKILISKKLQRMYRSDIQLSKLPARRN